MIPPMVSFITWNRMGLTVRNLTSLLDTTEDFELHIIDNNSKDSTWDYISSLKDSRIKNRIRFQKNRGPIYALNYNLSRRRPGQYFISLEPDVCIYTKNWIWRFMEVFEKYPEVGLLGVAKGTPYTGYLPPVVYHMKDGIAYLEVKHASTIDPLDFVPEHLQCIRPEVIDLIGYWSEESYYGDAEISARIHHYTPYKVGFVTTIEIDQYQEIDCKDCNGVEYCSLDRSTTHCNLPRYRKYSNPLFVAKYFWKNVEFFKELQSGKRSVFCASIHDEKSMEGHVYNSAWAEENFRFYEERDN